MHAVVDDVLLVLMVLILSTVTDAAPVDVCRLHTLRDGDFIGFEISLESARSTEATADDGSQFSPGLGAALVTAAALVTDAGGSLHMGPDPATGFRMLLPADGTGDHAV